MNYLFFIFFNIGDFLFFEKTLNSWLCLSCFSSSWVGCRIIFMIFKDMSFWIVCEGSISRWFIVLIFFTPSTNVTIVFLIRHGSRKLFKFRLSVILKNSYSVSKSSLHLPSFQFLIFWICFNFEHSFRRTLAIAFRFWFSEPPRFLSYSFYFRRKVQKKSLNLYYLFYL